MIQLHDGAGHETKNVAQQHLAFPKADERFEFNVEETNEHGPAIQRYPFSGEFTRVYMNGRSSVAAGSVLKQPDLAATLERLAAEGPQFLYGGALGQAIVAHLEALGGYMTMADLETVTPRWKEPIAVSYRGCEVHVPPPPCDPASDPTCKPPPPPPCDPTTAADCPLPPPPCADPNDPNTCKDPCMADPSQCACGPGRGWQDEPA